MFLKWLCKRVVKLLPVAAFLLLLRASSRDYSHGTLSRDMDNDDARIRRHGSFVSHKPTKEHSQRPTHAWLTAHSRWPKNNPATPSPMRNIVKLQEKSGKVYGEVVNAVHHAESQVANVFRPKQPAIYGFPRMLAKNSAEDWLRKMQEPADCSTRKFYVAKPRKPNQVAGGGLTSVIKELLGCFVMALADDRTFVVDDGPMGSYGLHFIDLFQQPSTCPPPAGGWAKHPNAKMVDTTPLRICFPDGPQSQFVPKHLLSRYEDMDSWKGELAYWLLRPTHGLTEHIEDARKALGIKPRPERVAEDKGLVGIHIRKGDRGGAGGTTGDAGADSFVGSAFAMQRRLATLVPYGQGFTREGVKPPELGASSRPPLPATIFLATDDAKQAAAAKVVVDGMQGDHGMRLATLSGQLRKAAMVKYLSSLDPSKAKAEGAHAALDITIDLMLLADADYFIGTCTSSVSLLAAQLMRARHIRQYDAGASHILIKDMTHLGGMKAGEADIVGEACMAHEVTYNNSGVITSAIEGADCIECGHGFLSG